MVLNGPFAGLKYPGFSSFGSAIYPKILGSYEKEIHSFLDTIFSKNYDSVIDIGSAEGYYSVGFAKKSFFSNKVVAVDINEDALILLKSIAALNEVEHKIETMNKIDFKQLGEMCSGKNNFIFCDCEGFEKEVFNMHNIQALRNSDLLIEIHDAKVHYVSKYIEQLFNESHRISRVSSTDDIQKLNSYQYPEMIGLSDAAKIKILSEGRGSIQEWFFIEAKQKL